VSFQKRLLATLAFASAGILAASASAAPSSSTRYPEFQTVASFEQFATPGVNWLAWIGLPEGDSLRFGNRVASGSDIGWSTGTYISGWAPGDPRDSIVEDILDRHRGEDDYVDFHRRFQDHGRDDVGYGHISPVPEAPTWALLAAGLAAIFLGKRFQSRLKGRHPA
jgi:hypothetical protein